MWWPRTSRVDSHPEILSRWVQEHRLRAWAQCEQPQLEVIESLLYRLCHGKQIAGVVDRSQSPISLWHLSLKPEWIEAVPNLVSLYRQDLECTTVHISYHVHAGTGNDMADFGTSKGPE